MASEVWLAGNRRPVVFALVAAELITLSGVLSMLFARSNSLWWIGVSLLVASQVLSLFLALRLIQPRIGYANNELQLYLRGGSPICVPIDLVEGFLIGQSPAVLPGAELSERESKNLVIRIAERATEWERCDVHPDLAKWCGGYVTIYGTWCEPLSVDTANRLNERLNQAHRTSQARSQI